MSYYQKKKAEGYKMVHTFVPVDIAYRLYKLSRKKHKRLSFLVAEAIKMYVEAEEKKDG